jgi:hypothetical protein
MDYQYDTGPLTPAGHLYACFQKYGYLLRKYIILKKE